MMLGHVNPEKHNQVCEYIAIIYPHVTVFFFFLNYTQFPPKVF